jgi:chromosome partitioning protein
MVATEQSEGSPPTFEDLFANPTVEGMLKLSWQDFQSFVMYVFQNAGYAVEFLADVPFPEGPGVDLGLHSREGRGRLLAYVEVKQWAPHRLLDFSNVMHVLGVLNLNRNTPGFLVTTSDFGGPAREAERQAGDKLYLLSGERFVRYIRYINGSRIDGSFDGIPAIPKQPISPAELEKADLIARDTALSANRPRILTVANPKGGVAKTTTALNMGLALARPPFSKRVLLVDMDGQGSLSHDLPRKQLAGAPPTDPPPPDTTFLSDYFKGIVSLSKVARETRFTDVSLIPAHPDLNKFQFAGAERTRAEWQFTRDIRKAWAVSAHGDSTPPYDWIVLDTPAGDTFFGRAALATADDILAPFCAEEFATQGLLSAFSIMATMTALMGESPDWQSRVVGLLLTRWRQSRNSTDALNKVVLYAQSVKVRQFQTVIPLDDKIETANQNIAQGGLKVLFGLGARPSPAAVAYVEVVKELVRYVSGN